MKLSPAMLCLVLLAACGGKPAAAPGPAQPVAAPVDPVPSCEATVDHAISLIRDEMERNLAEMAPSAREHARAEFEGELPRMRARAVKGCQDELSEDQRRCVMRAGSLAEVEGCDDERRADGEGEEVARAVPPDGGPDAACEQVADHVMAVLERDMEKMLEALPEDKRKELRERMATEKDKNRAELLDRCNQESTPGLRACILRGQTLADFDACAPERDAP